jgi:hypothetical protein
MPSESETGAPKPTAPLIRQTRERGHGSNGATRLGAPDKKRSGKARYSKAKGKQFEREVADRLSELLEVAVIAEGYDHDVTFRTIVPFYSQWHLELKRGERVSLPAAHRQCDEDALEQGKLYGAVIYRSNRTPTRVSLDLELFARMVKRIAETGGF